MTVICTVLQAVGMALYSKDLYHHYVPLFTNPRSTPKDFNAFSFSEILQLKFKRQAASWYAGPATLMNMNLQIKKWKEGEEGSFILKGFIFFNNRILFHPNTGIQV